MQRGGGRCTYPQVPLWALLPTLPGTRGMKCSPAFAMPSDLTYVLLSVLGATGCTGPCPCYLLASLRPTGIPHAGSGLEGVGDRASPPSLCLGHPAVSTALLTSPKGCCSGSTSSEAGARPSVYSHLWAVKHILWRAPKERKQPLPDFPQSSSPLVPRPLVTVCLADKTH